MASLGRVEPRVPVTFPPSPQHGTHLPCLLGQVTQELVDGSLMLPFLPVAKNLDSCASLWSSPPLIVSCFIPRQHVFLIPSEDQNWEETPAEDHILGHRPNLHSFQETARQQSNRHPLTHSHTFPHPQINHLDGLACVVSY